MFLNALLPVVALLVMAALFAPRVRRAEFWRATVTPLASIIGSGFLVIAPLLGYAMGVWAPLAMVAIVAVAYAVGAVVRFNIRHLEPLLDQGHPGAQAVERLANAALGVAYVISVAFYVRLLAAFLLHPWPAVPDWAANLLTTLVLAGIGVIGMTRGLRGLEWVERSAVTVKLGIIAALLAGLLFADAGWLNGESRLQVHGIDDPGHALRMLAGMLLVVQGFETSRYLGAAYDAEMRVRSMRSAQWLTSIVYVAFVVLALPMLGPYLVPPKEAAIIDTGRQIAWVLPPMLIVAALTSQLSAAVADTAGSGGMFAESTRGRVPRRAGYAAVALGAIVLVWSVEVFGIVAIASRAFAVYYLIQCILAGIAAGTMAGPTRRLALRGGFFALAAGLAAVAIFAVPAESD